MKVMLNYHDLLQMKYHKKSEAQANELEKIVEGLLDTLDKAMGLIPENVKPVHPLKEKESITRYEKRMYNRAYRKWRKTEDTLNEIYANRKKYERVIYQKGIFSSITK